MVWFDSSDVVVLGYPLLGVLALWQWPRVASLAFLAGAVIAVPLFLFLSWREPKVPGRSFPWGQLFIVGVALSWPFIVAMLLQRFRKDRRPESKG